jgi:hypothetical protein
MVEQLINDEGIWKEVAVLVLKYHSSTHLEGQSKTIPSVTIVGVVSR